MRVLYLSSRLTAAENAVSLALKAHCVGRLRRMTADTLHSLTNAQNMAVGT